ncbi:sugar ABC transporter substrate-binding protein [Leucobacter sp. CSA1]|uniref:Sugar ABC transporter substrate-binding protein n=1 Tax=Leucobacter chromiisoli TaxID=2796471 RepID=A0A934UVZ3_9MICO|nr:sugar ABC transporter substrate-binding protein [Leucobacter chromiisoli]MBK0420006.1 sugar ABC transporter substrate-binding protein [Leucobacter chromiisoli]
MRTQRLLAAAGAAALALSLGACSSQEAAGAPESGGDGKGAIAWSFPSQDVAVWADQLVFMEPIIEEAGYEFLTHDPGFDAQKQVNDWQAWIARGDVKAMGGFPLDANLVAGVTTEAETAGIPLVGYIIEWPGVAASTLTPAYEGGVELGKAAGEWIVENYDSENVGVAILGDFGNPYGQEQARGYRDGLAETDANVTVADLQTLDRNEGHANMQSQLTADPDTRVVLSAGADMGLGARQAIVDSGVSQDDPEWFIGATDATDEVLDLIATGDDIWRTAFVSKTSELAESNAQLLIDAAEGRSVETTTVPATEITPDNVDEFRSPTK